MSTIIDGTDGTNAALQYNGVDVATFDASGLASTSKQIKEQA